MPPTAEPLDDLAHRIAQQQSELERLRQEYESRQAQLADLARRQGELQAQLHQVETEIQAVAQGTIKVSAARPTKPVPAKTRPVASRSAKKKLAKKALPGKASPGHPAAGRRDQPSLKVVLTGLLKKTTKLRSGGELAKEALKAGYRTQSKDFPNVVRVMLGKMNTIENVAGQGYRLKKAKG